MVPTFGRTGSIDSYLPALLGFAANGVKEVVAYGASGVLARAPVVDNVFAADVPVEPVYSVEAYDASGKTVWSLPLR